MEKAAEGEMTHKRQLKGIDVDTKRENALDMERQELRKIEDEEIAEMKEDLPAHVSLSPTVVQVVVWHC